MTRDQSSRDQPLPVWSMQVLFNLHWGKQTRRRCTGNDVGWIALESSTSVTTHPSVCGSPEKASPSRETSDGHVSIKEERRHVDRVKLQGCRWDVVLWSETKVHVEAMLMMMMMMLFWSTVAFPCNEAAPQADQSRDRHS
jgi:hypothetical protein